MGEDKERLKGERKTTGGLNDRNGKKRSGNALDYENRGHRTAERRAETAGKACKEADKEESERVMELIIIAVLAALLPIMTISAFVVGYNCNAPKKILKKSKKHKPTDDELMLERIDKATV